MANQHETDTPHDGGAEQEQTETGEDDGDTDPLPYAHLAPLGARIAVDVPPGDPAPWPEDAHETLLGAIRNAPGGYRVRGWFTSADGDLRDYIVVPPEAVVGDAPEIVPASRERRAPHEMFALYEVRFPTEAFASYDVLDDVEAHVRARHAARVERHDPDGEDGSHPVYDAGPVMAARL